MIIRFCMICRRTIKPVEDEHSKDTHHRVCDICGNCPDCDKEKK